ncbi:hypothetical protein CRENBAI_007741 [Crenichthys baileyi]|uniref:Uncharacterized protein n=1 Tax=Crenichthys baileyi TaxID=28760 RepID=A0AAV9RLT6_9TELE
MPYNGEEEPPTNPNPPGVGIPPDPSSVTAAHNQPRTPPKSSRIVLPLPRLPAALPKEGLAQNQPPLHATLAIHTHSGPILHHRNHEPAHRPKDSWKNSILGFFIKICNSKCEEPLDPLEPLDPRQKWSRSEPQTEHRNTSRTTAGTTATPPKNSREEPQGKHSVATVQKPQGAAATNPQTLPAVVYAGADPAMDPETQDPGDITH